MGESTRTKKDKLGLRQRLISALILLAPVISIVLAGGIWAAAGAALIFSICALEFVRLVARRGHRAFSWIMVTWTLLFCVAQALPQYDLLGAEVALLMAVTLGWTLVRYKEDTSEAFIGFALTLAGALYIGWGGAHLVGIRGYPEGIFWTLSLLLIVWAGDIGAFFIGSWLGRTPLLPQVSPHKTVEGFLGGYLCTMLVAALLPLGWARLGAAMAASLPHHLVLGVLIGLAAPVGDLGMSVLKRYTQAKDSSNLIPGHGGFLDRVDSLLISSLIVYYYLRLFVMP